jgi:hypothetical protein
MNEQSHSGDGGMGGEMQRERCGDSATFGTNTPQHDAAKPSALTVDLISLAVASFSLTIWVYLLPRGGPGPGDNRTLDWPW